MYISMWCEVVDLSFTVPYSISHCCVLMYVVAFFFHVELINMNQHTQKLNHLKFYYNVLAQHVRHHLVVIK